MLTRMGTDKKRSIRVTAEQIRAERAASGLSQRALAEKAGIPEQTYIRYETGKRDVPTAALLAIVDGLGMSLSTFARRLQDRLDEPDQ